MVAIALYNRYGLVPCFQRSGACAQQPLITTRQVAIILAAAVLLTVSWFATRNPPGPSAGQAKLIDRKSVV